MVKSLRLRDNRLSVRETGKRRCLRCHQMRDQLGAASDQHWQRQHHRNSNPDEFLCASHHVFAIIITNTNAASEATNIV